MPPRVLITDPVDEELVRGARELGAHVDYRPGISREELERVIGGYNCLVVRGRLRLDRELLSRAAGLRLIIRYGVGLDNIDLGYCREAGIEVRNTPDAFTEAVAEHTLALILGVLRDVGRLHCSMVEGGWAKAGAVGSELRGKTVGIIGFGRVGRRVAELLQPFDVKILVYTRGRVPEQYLRMGVERVGDLLEIARRSDIVTIHVPLTEETRGMIGEEFLSACKPGVYIVNTSRGEVIDEEALKRHLRAGRIAGIALDVFRNEPNVDRELLRAGRGLFTPHVGGQTVEAWRRAAKEALEILKSRLLSSEG